MVRGGLAAAGMLLLAACAAGSNPKVDTEAEATAIRALDQQWSAAVAKGDAAASAAFYAPDGKVMPANAPAVQGMEAVKTWWAGLLGTAGMKLSFAPTTIEVAQSGELAVDIGTWQGTVTAPSGTTHDNGKYIVVWKKVDGVWKAANDIFNSDNPPAAPPAK